MLSLVVHELDKVRLRASDEDKGRRPNIGGGGRGKGGGQVQQTEHGLCFVSVSHRPASSPGAASARYHENERGEIRDGVEILRDDDVAEWKGDRYSIIVSPHDSNVPLDIVATHMLTVLEDRYGTLRGGAWVHRDKERHHLHIAIDGRAADGRPVRVPLAVVEQAADRAIRMTVREKAREHSR